MLPFKPEPINKLRQRYTKALEDIYLAEPDLKNPPSGKRKHVFDFNSGLRLIISRDILKGKEPDIHVSASWFDEDKFGDIDEAYFEIVNSFKSIGGKGRLKFIGLTDKKIPHFVVEKVN